MSLRDTPFPLEEALRLDALERHRITDTRRDEAFDRLVQAACAALQAPMGAISFLEDERLWVKASHGIGQGIGLGETPCDTSFCAHTLMDDDMMVVEDARRDPRFAANPYVTEQEVRFYAGAPLITAEGYPLGTLSVMDHIPRQMAGHDRQLLKDFAAVVMGEMELRRTLGTDTITGLYTRSFFDEVAGREMIRARRDSRPLAAAFLDVDPRKRRNDQPDPAVGPAAGDWLLRALGLAATRVLRDSDLLGRHDGEKLVFLLPATSLRQAGPVLERLRREIAGRVIPEWAGQQVTVSIGAAELVPEDLTVADLLARADTALQRARSAGRNRVALAA